MIEYIFISFVGILMVIVAVKFYHKKAKTKKKGLVAEGIVYELRNDPSSSFNVIYPVIRFLTLNQEWITETSSTGTFPGYYKKGQKVNVIYNQENPKEFFINSKINNLIIYTVLTIGFLLILFGTYKLI